MNRLPEQWYCNMNRWDPYRASCTSPEEVNTESTSPTRSKGGGGGETQKSVASTGRRLSGGNHDHDAAGRILPVIIHPFVIHFTLS